MRRSRIWSLARAEPGCSTTLDACCVHAFCCCSWGNVCRRHDKLRDLVAQAARPAGVATVTEQNMVVEPDTPRAARGVHRADVRIVEPDGRQLWVDVKVTSTKPNEPKKTLGLPGRSCELQAVWSRATTSQHTAGVHDPFAAEAHRRLAPMADALTSNVITRQAHVIEERQGCTPSSALCQALGLFWEPLFCHLFTAGWLGIVHYARGVELAACQTRRPNVIAGCQADSAILE